MRKERKNNKQLIDNAYTYDKANNVTNVTNSGTSANEFGGTMAHNYIYDGLYRLTKAYGDYNKGNNTKNAHYDLAMTYDNLHNITSKKQDIVQTGVKFDGLLKAGYDLTYAYANNPQQISTIADESYRTEETATTDTISKT
ncbi:MAG: hypothetical protein M0P26_06690 [Bacteroidales bacterium]|nr:hypothetical protein [Bacteroidales bacterium]